MNHPANDRMNFIELLNEEFLSNTGYGAYAFISTCDGVNLYERFSEQSQPANLFIKKYIKQFHK